MRKIQKLIISNYDDIHNPDYAGGGAIAINKLVKYLSTKYEVILITGKYPGAKDEIIEGVKHRRIGSHVFGGKIGHLFYLLALPFVCLNEDFDLWIDSFTPPFSVSPVPLFVKKSKIIGLVHMLSGNDMKRKYKMPFDIIERVGLRLYKNIIVLTDASKKEILKINPEAHVYVIPNGVDIPKESSLCVKKKKQILFIGRIEVDQKGLDLLLQSYKSVLKKINIKLAIAGTGTQSEVIKLKKLISDLELTNKVKLKGRVDSYKKSKLIRESLMIIIPSRFETLSMTALEALANKTLLITFDIDGFKWLSEETSVKVPFKDLNMLTEKIIEFSDNRPKCEIFMQKGYKFILNYSWTKVFKEYKKVIDSILLEI